MRSPNKVHIIIGEIGCRDPIVDLRIPNSHREAAAYRQSPEKCRVETAIEILHAGIAPGEEVILERVGAHPVHRQAKRVNRVGTDQIGVTETMGLGDNIISPDSRCQQIFRKRITRG